MKRTARQSLGHNAQLHNSISGLLLTRGFDATLSFFCTLFVFSLD
ncbi:MAG: hypothetical protein PHP05_01865 [Sideroxydans sp.]|nr:hypothetical protein [Sideroxydans sp.]MDD5470648.1 hypothetical protein [Sideroxydans sp.]